MGFFDFFKPKIYISKDFFEYIKKIKYKIKCNTNNDELLENLMGEFVDNIFNSKISSPTFRGFIQINLLRYIGIKESFLQKGDILSGPIVFNYSMSKLTNILKDAGIEDILIGMSDIEGGNNYLILYKRYELQFLTEFFIVIVSNLLYYDKYIFDNKSVKLLDCILPKELMFDYSNFIITGILSDKLQGFLEDN